MPGRETCRRKDPAFAGSVSLDETKERDVLATSRLALAAGTRPHAPKATFRETAAPAWLEIDMRHARTMRAVARAGWIGSYAVASS